MPTKTSVTNFSVSPIPISVSPSESLIFRLSDLNKYIREVRSVRQSYLSFGDSTYIVRIPLTMVGCSHKALEVVRGPLYTTQVMPYGLTSDTQPQYVCGVPRLFSHEFLLEREWAHDE